MTVPPDNHGKRNTITVTVGVLIGLLSVAVAWSIATRVQNRDAPPSQAMAHDTGKFEKEQRQAKLLQAEANRAIASGATDCGVSIFTYSDSDHSAENKRFSRVPVDDCVTAALAKHKPFRAQYIERELSSGSERTIIGTKEGDVYHINHSFGGDFSVLSAKVERHAPNVTRNK